MYELAIASDIAVFPVVYTIKNSIAKTAYMINNDFIIISSKVIRS